MIRSRDHLIGDVILHQYFNSVTYSSVSELLLALKGIEEKYDDMSIINLWPEQMKTMNKVSKKDNAFELKETVL